LTLKYDGLGRQSQTQHLTPSGASYVTTTYDPLGRVASVTNPYFSTSDPTYGVTQTQYDALGRVTQTLKPDSSISAAQYSGSCATSTDEAGKSRRACNDGLGRLIEVDEPQAASVGTSATASVTISGNLQVANSTTGAQPPNAVSGSALSAYELS